MKMINETWSPEEWKEIVENISLDPVAIAVAAAFEGGFEQIDCRDLADVWDTLQRVVQRDDQLLKHLRGYMMEAGDRLMHLEIIETYDYVPSFTHDMLSTLAQEWAELIMQRLYGAPDEGKYKDA